MKAFPLYFRYALRSFRRGRSRSVFAAFCVAVGIASVVALGLVGSNFQDAVTGNAQKINRGDVSVSFPKPISLQDYSYFARLKQHGKLVDYTSRLWVDAQFRASGGQSNRIVGSLVAVEGRKFPFYDTITAGTPAGRPLASLLRNPHDAVVSQYVYDTFHLHIGSRITAAFHFGGGGTYTVRGVVPDDAPDRGFGVGLFPYWIMADRSSISSYMQANDSAASDVYVKTTDASQARAVKASIERHFGELVSPKTVTDVQKDQANSADGFSKFFRLMGLVALVIGGIGIINTMLVATRRRTREIAVLKSIGMKSRQVILVFTLESLMVALTGVALGLGLGVLASLAVNSVTQSLAGYDIPWSLHAAPLLAGSLVGIAATVLFSYLPVLQASRARPVASLREGADQSPRPRSVRALLRALRSHPLRTIGTGLRNAPMGLIRLPKRQGLRTAGAVLLVAVLMGYVAVLYAGLASGAQTVILGGLAGIGTLLVAGLLIQVFVLLVWLVSKLPAMGRLSARMAFRSMGTQKRRLASTLLALCIGMLSIGSVFILAQNLKHEAAQSIETRQGFNVVVQTPHSRTTQLSVDQAVRSLPGIDHRSAGAIANNLTLIQANGRSVGQLVHRALAPGRSGAKVSKDTLQQAVADIRGVAGRDLTGSADAYLMAAGRNLDRRDADTDHIVVSQQFADPFGIRVGSHLVYAEGGRTVHFTVVGITSSTGFMIIANSMADLSYMERTGLTTPAPSHNALVFLQVRQSDLKGDVARLQRALPGALVLDLSSFLEILQAVDKLALLPEIIAALSLFAGVVIIANTVALAMLERRREIGVIKAMGAKRRTVLQFLLVEQAVVGFLGAAAGVGLAMAAAYLVNRLMFQMSTGYDWLTVGGLVLVGVVLAVGASALTALPASSQKPMSVLRYE